MDSVATRPAIPIAPSPDVQSIRRPLPEAVHLPGRVYTSSDVFERELVEYFGREWLYLGRVEQFPAPGDYEARRVLGRPIVLARSRTGELNAFYNMCRHRGVEVAQGSGNTKFFSCPYHGWTYDLEGKLVGAAYMKETQDFDLSGCRLPRIGLHVWRGNIFINFADDPKDFETAMGGIESDFGFLQTDRCRLADVATTELACNWKFFHENLMDYYHVGVLHAKTFGAKFSWTADNLVLKDNGGLTMHYKSAPSTPEGVALFGKMPWLAERGNDFACTGFFPPNVTMFARVDMVKFITAWPLGTDRCEVKIYMLFPEDFHADPQFADKLEVYRRYQHQIYDEDRSMIESMQKAMSLPQYRPGRLSVMEKPIHHFLGSYVRRMFGNAGADADRLDASSVHPIAPSSAPEGATT